MKNSSQDECKQISPNHKHLTRLCASLRKQNSNIMECQAMKMQQTQFPISNSNSSFQFPIPISNANFQVQFPMPISNSNFQRYNFQFNSNSQKEPAPPRSRWRAPITPSCRASRGSHTARRFALRPLIFFLRWQAIVRIAVDPNFPCSAMRRMRANTQSDSGRMKRNYNECTA